VLKCWKRWDKNPIEISKEQCKGQTTLAVWITRSRALLRSLFRRIFMVTFKKGHFRLNTDEYIVKKSTYWKYE